MRLIEPILMLWGLLACSQVLRGAGVTYLPPEGAGNGKHIVLVAGDDEYHSEEALPQLAKILAVRHGFRCTVLFTLNPADGTIDRHAQNLPGLEELEKADLLILFTRFRDLPDDQMKRLVDYIESGRPMIGLRTATHAFRIPPASTYARYSFDSKLPGWEGGFGRRVLGETWINHHGQHSKQSTRAVLVKEAAASPILRGIGDREIWVPTDVYKVRLPLPADCRSLLLGEVVAGMASSDPAAAGPVNDPMMPVAWTNSYRGESGKTARVFATTMGAADDLESVGFRRLLVNAAYWSVGLEERLPAKANVDYVGEYRPHPFTWRDYVRGVKPADLAIR
jgi:hypothetical protein